MQETVPVLCGLALGAGLGLAATRQLRRIRHQNDLNGRR
jgi:hypothetical protein